MTIYIGIDPGLSGGIAMLRDEGQWTPTVTPMPVSGGEIDARAAVEDLALLSDVDRMIVVVESVHSMPKQGVASTFKFGKGYGKILGALEVLQIRTELVTPQAWKAVVLAGTTKDKDAAVAWCRRAYPTVNLILPKCRTPHDGMADALCIAEWGQRTIK
jgi:hypothetical protein